MSDPVRIHRRQPTRLPGPWDSPGKNTGVGFHFLFENHHCLWDDGKSALGSNDPPQRRRQWHPTPVLLPGKSHGRRSLVGCSPWGPEESDTTERLHFHFSLSCIGEGNGNPLQCFCLENPRDGGAWWAAVYGFAHSWTRLRQLSSSRRLKSFFTNK